MHLCEAILAEGLSPVFGDVQHEPEDVHEAIVLRVDANLAEVERTRVQRARPRPGVAAIGRPEDAAAPAEHLIDALRPAIAALDDRDDHLRVLREDGEPDSSGLDGQAAGQLLPRGACVDAPVNATHVAALRDVRARVERPGRAPPRVEHGVDGVRVLRIDRDVTAACRDVIGRGRLQDGLPRPAAIGRLEETTLGVVVPEIADGRHVGDRRVGRMHGDSRHRLACRAGPRRPTSCRRPWIGRRRAPAGAVAIVCLPGAEPDDLRIGRRDRHGASRGKSCLSVRAVKAPPLSLVFMSPPCAVAT